MSLGRTTQEFGRFKTNLKNEAFYLKLFFEFFFLWKRWGLWI